MKKTHVLLLIIFLAAIFLRIYPLKTYSEWDESIYLQHAEILRGEKSNYDEWDIRPPLLPILIAGTFYIWHSIFAAQILLAFLTALIVPAMYLLGRKFHDEKAGIFAALLSALYPAFVRYGNMILTDALVSMMLAFALLLALNRDVKLIAAGGFIAGLAALTKFTALAPICAITIYLVWKEWKKIPRKAAAFGLSSLLILLPYLAWAHHRWGSPFHPFLAGVEVATGAASEVWLLYAFPLSMLAGFALLAYYKKKGMQDYALMSVAWFLLIMIPVANIHIETRYLLPALIPFIPLAGIGFARATEELDWEYITAAATFVIILGSAPAYFQLATPFIHTHLPSQVEMAKTIEGYNDTLPIYASRHYPVYGYYTDNPIEVVDGPGFAQYYPQMLRETGYLPVYKDAQRPPTVEWAEENPRAERISENEDIVLYRYIGIR